MSYQFDPSQLRAESKVRLTDNVAQVRLLARRTARQTRRIQRAI